MRLGWALLLGVLGGVAIAWWLARNTPAEARAKQARAEHATAAAAQAARPVLYRWRDDGGTVHVTQAPPKGRRFERIAIQPQAGIEVHGDRD